MTRKHILLLVPFLLLFGCTEEPTNIASVDDRIDAAVSELVDNLTDPPNGWKLRYQPTPESGIYLMFMNFNDQGQVIVKSDLADEDGAFFEQTIQYRIDAGLGLELVLETYGLFHYLFEQDQASFGAEFEFLFDKKDGNNLLFLSKTDPTLPTVLLFEPATSSSEEDILSRDLATNLNTFDCNNSRILGQGPCVQHFILDDRNMSLFWSIDVSKRQLIVDMFGAGSSLDEVLSNTDNVIINHETGYGLEDGKIVLVEPFNFSFRGEQLTISDVSLSNLTMTGNPICPSNPESTPVMTGTFGSLGSVTAVRSLFSSSGLDFQPMEETPYSVNPLFIFTPAPIISLLQDGSIAEKIPTTIGFVFNYGFVSDDGQPSNAIGFIVEDANRNRTTYLREFEATTTVGNRIQVTLTDNVYTSGTPTAIDEQSVREITEEILGEGEIYASLVPLDDQDIKVYRLMNPCNGYEFFLVQN